MAGGVGRFLLGTANCLGVVFITRQYGPWRQGVKCSWGQPFRLPIPHFRHIFTVKMQTVRSVVGTLTAPPMPVATQEEGYHLLIDRATGALVVAVTGGTGQPDADGAPATANPTLVAGVDGGGLVRTMSVLSNGHLQVDIGNATIVGGNILVQLDAASDSVEVKQSTHDNLNGNMNLQVGDADVSGVNPVPVSFPSIPLPTGAATETTLSALNAKVTACNTGSVTVAASALPAGAATQTTLASIDGKLTACNTGSVTVVASALPTGAATQTTLASIDGKLTACNTGAVTVSSSVLPTGAATETTLGDVKAGVGATADAAIITDTTGSLSGKLRGLVKWAFERMPAALGQTTKSGSLPVAIASDQGALTVDTELPAAAALADGAANPTTSPIGACIKGFNGATWDRGRWPSKFIDMNAVSISSIATLWTPAGGKKFRLLGGTFSVSAAASVLFEDNGAGTTIFRTPKLAADAPYNFDLGPTGVLSGAADRILKGTSSAAATITGTLYGTEE